MRYTIATKVNILAILAMLSIICGAYVVEFFHHELPCPLCLLQRFGFLAITFGFLLNIKYGIQMKHYGFSLCAALFTASIAMRQILFHIFTVSGTYGSAFFGFHLYTWSFIASVAIIVFIALEMIFSDTLQYTERSMQNWMEKIIKGVFYITILFVITNVITTFLLCGFAECPENPTSYKYLISWISVPLNFTFCS